MSTAAGSGAASPGGERAVPFYCPYCGEEDLEPVGDRGGWWCHSCNRRFVLRSDGSGAPPTEG
ncbi:MAG TPA: hypothetical protein VHZ96_03965 [Frankiaceae bacterium]|nr:hypothetical protein [Frankiaceae bacterium]